jgi:hypothetical protein
MPNEECVCKQLGIEKKNQAIKELKTTGESNIVS